MDNRQRAHALWRELKVITTGPDVVREQTSISYEYPQSMEPA
jgi:hypothetical protein